MNRESIAPETAWLDQRVEFLQQLADSLKAAQGAVVRNDLAKLRGQTSRQQLLCEQLRRLAEVASVESAEANHETEKRKTDLQEDLAQTELEVARLNRVYGALLRRASRTVNIFCRVLAASSPTYAVPQCSTIGSVSEKE